MAFISAFDVLGPNMIGPSSSHTAGAAKIAFLAHKMINGKIRKANFTLYGSFAETYLGHGTDRALLGGVLGFTADDRRIRDSYCAAESCSLEYSFKPDFTETEIYPNTVDIELENDSGETLTVRGESVGGGKVRITRINGVEVDFSGEYSTVIVIHRDRPGLVAHISKCLCDRNVNIAFMRLFRESRGSKAYSIVESDGMLPDGLAESLYENEYVYNVMLVQAQ